MRDITHLRKIDRKKALGDTIVQGSTLSHIDFTCQIVFQTCEMRRYILQNVKYSLQGVVQNTAQTPEIQTPEKIRMKTPEYIYAAFAVFCAFTFVIGMVNATAATPFALNSTSGNSFGLGCSQSPDMIITHLEQSGIDVTEVKTALANGNTDAVTTWLENHRAANPPVMMNGSMRPPLDLTNTTEQQQILTRLEKQGVDVTELKTALQNGNTDAAKTWLENYFETHRMEMGKGIGRPGFDLTNTTEQQQILSRLEQQGVDVSELKTALQNGNTAAAKTWLDTYMQSHKPDMPGARMKRGQSTT